jgi:hypothetical protein
MFGAENFANQNFSSARCAENLGCTRVDTMRTDGTMRTDMRDGLRFEKQSSLRLCVMVEDQQRVRYACQTSGYVPVAE